VLVLWRRDSRDWASSRRMVSVPTCPRSCSPRMWPSTLTGMLIAGRPARLPGTVNTSLTYVSTGENDVIVDNSGAGPMVVGQSIMSHLYCVEVCFGGRRCRIFSCEKTSSNEYCINRLTL